MNKPYFSLFVRRQVRGLSFTGCRWAVEFGDYDREVVEEERDYLKDEASYDDEYKIQCKIVRTSADQASIDAAIKALNHPSYADNPRYA